MASATLKEPTVVRVTRPVFDELAKLYRLSNTFPLPADEAAELVSDEQTKQWISGNPDRYERGVHLGFMLRRYRVGIYYTDGTRISIREGDDKTLIGEYAQTLLEGYKRRGYYLKPEEDEFGSIGIYTSDRTRKHGDLRVELITDGPIPVANQRDPLEGAVDPPNGGKLP